MKIKKYFAGSFNEGKVAIQADLGEDAIILSSKNTVDANGNPIFEIVAAIDDANSTKRPMKEKLSEIKTLSSMVSQAGEPENNVTMHNYDHIFAEVANIKLTLNDINDQIKYKYSTALSKDLSNLYKTLRKAELNDDLALKMINFLSKKNHQLSYDELFTDAKKYLAKELFIAETLVPKDKSQTVMFVGPTGSGKTMSLVKIAIVCKWVHKASVLIISSDTYKVGGSEQLQTYSSIAGLPFRIAYTANEIKSIIEAEQHYDFVFIDTPGRSYKNKDYVNELQNIQKSIRPDQTYLTLNANMSEATISDIISKFSQLKPTGTVLTKLDEIYRVGGVYSALVNNKIPLAYFTTGQQIPDEVEPADSNKFIDMMFEDL